MAGANRWRNASAPPGRDARWERVRDELWELVSPLLPARATVAIAGAGNGDDLPLARLAGRAGRVDLIDIDKRALRRAIRRAPHLRAVAQDVTDGWADRIVRAAIRGETPPNQPRPLPPLGSGDYDLVIGDMLYSQLLFPALLDANVPPARRAATLASAGRELTTAVVEQFHRASRVVVHLHDIAGWWRGHPQPIGLHRALALGPRVVDKGLNSPLGCDPRASVEELGHTIARTAIWPWPFCDRVDYLVCATVAAHSAMSTSADGRAASWNTV